MNELNVLKLKVESSMHNCRVGNRYPMRPGMVPAQSKAIFKTVDHAAGEFLGLLPLNEFLLKTLKVQVAISHPLQKMFDVANANRVLPDLIPLKGCVKGGFCEPGGGHGSFEWCDKCNNII